MHVLIEFRDDWLPKEPRHHFSGVLSYLGMI
ncbi:unnamed protein product [Acanthoscelides obtectus]|uniref:Uncharacterized protein n=1 Tax=Acanthoscelides obtectus TaxID=200917 RepID=A0A9P0LI11_ACAOB|nr:unnamed protein product [Acanthoscelides obtectus]CAK1673036.1 hypothetical protein AOBTE_LOCUS29215 [Acanthoscelides obtectus]